MLIPQAVAPSRNSWKAPDLHAPRDAKAVSVERWILDLWSCQEMRPLWWDWLGWMEEDVTAPHITVPPNAALHSADAPGSSGKCCNVVLCIFLKGLFPAFKNKKQKIPQGEKRSQIESSHFSISFPFPASRCSSSPPCRQI